MKIIFFGTPKFAVEPLKALVEADYPIEAVVTNPDKPKGRGGRGRKGREKKRKVKAPPLKTEALSHGLTVLQPHSLRTDKEFLQQIKDLKPDLFILSAYAKIIPGEYINIPRLGTINIHPSLLPEHRGPSPIQFSILEGDKKTGVTLILLDEKFDHGPILAQEEYPLTGKENFMELHDALSILSAKMLVKLLPDFIEGKAKGTPQDHSRATYTKIFTRQDGEIDWKESAEQIDRQIRALSDNPGTHTFFETDQTRMLKVHKAEPQEKEFGKEPGTVVMDNNEIYVQTGKGSMKLIEIQIAGRNKLSAQEFANGRKTFVGTRLKGYRE